MDVTIHKREGETIHDVEDAARNRIRSLRFDEGWIRFPVFRSALFLALGVLSCTTRYSMTSRTI